MADYIERNMFLKIISHKPSIPITDREDRLIDGFISAVKNCPAADVLPRDEAIKMGAELAAMHGSDATSQQLEEAYLKGVEDGMTRRDVRPAVRGHIEEDENTYLFCSECNCNITLAAYETPDNRLVLRPNFCPNCGAMMEES